MASYLLETYGCQMNAADAEILAGLLEDAGWRPVADASDADLIVVNTCAVRERAVERVIGHVRGYLALKTRRPGLRIAVVGCLARYGVEDLRRALPGVDLLLGPDAYRELPELLARGTQAPHREVGLRPAETYADLRPVRAPGISAWVTIMRGCDRRCAYCVVPLARGPERSLPARSVLDAIGDAVARGHVSVTLLGQTVTSYHDGTCDLAALLEAAAACPGLRRLAFLAPHPTDFTPRLLEVMARHPVIARHLHLPVQSGSNRVLAAMRRDYTREDYLALVRAARDAIPGLGLTTDVIVGFPGETAEDFRATGELLDAVRFDGAFMFAYSPRPRTHAARFLRDDVPPEEKQRRLAEVIALQESCSRERYARFVGAVVGVLVSGPARHPEGHWFGRTDDHRDVVFAPRPGAPPQPGMPVDVLVTQASSHTLRGDQVGEGCERVALDIDSQPRRT